MSAAPLPQCQHLIQGLWWPSETEAPWTLARWTLAAIAPPDLRAALHREATAPVVELTLANLMADLRRRCQGYGAEGQALVQRYETLATWLEAQCDRVQVFRVGTVTIDLVVIGATPTGLVILQTQSVET